MKNASYSVLLMRDDADVKTLRVSPRRLKLLRGSALCWPWWCWGLVMGLRSFVGYRSVLAERRDLEVRLAEAQVELERLGNLEKIQNTAPAAGKNGKASTERPYSRHRGPSLGWTSAPSPWRTSRPSSRARPSPPAST
jgi:hypothetical protein